MPDIEFNCPHCKQSLAVEESGAGMEVDCPGCNEKLIVPSSLHCQSCGKTLPQGITHCIACGGQAQKQEQPPVAQETTCSVCPSCGKQLPRGVRYCIACGSSNGASGDAPTQPADSSTGISLICPGGMCKTRFIVPNEMAGQLVKCPDCHKEIEVVGSGRFPEIKPTPEEPPKPTLGQLKKKTEFRLGKSPQGPVPEPSTKNCPSCGKAIHQNAVICVHCGLNLETGTVSAAQVETAKPASRTKTCPYCAEEILSAAIKCKYCQSDLSGATVPSAVTPQPQQRSTVLHQPASAPTPHCPMCGKPVQADAVICINCGLNLKTGVKAQSAFAQPAFRISSGVEDEDSSWIANFNKPLVVAIVVIVLVAGAFYFGRSRSSENQSAASAPSPQPTASAPPDATTKPSIPMKTLQEEAKDAVKKGLMYGTGNGVQKDEAEAVRWFRKAAEAGNSEGMYNLGIAYANGLGVEKNMVEAVKWFRMGVDAGKKDGMYYLGVAYASGLGVEKNEAEAVNWYRKAIEVGDAGAMLSLGVMYWEGRGVKQDLAEGTRLFQKAAELGNPTAKENLAKAQEYAKQQQAQQQQPKWEDIMERGNRKNPPDRDAAEILLKAASDKWVKQQIDGGNLISGSYIQCDFEYPRNHESVDSKATFAYQFVFYTKSGHQRRNIGYVVWVHYFQKREWFMSDTLTTIDGMPTNL